MTAKHLGLKILGSFLSVVAGWVACVLVWTMIVGGSALMKNKTLWASLQEALFFGVYVAAIGGVLILGTWAVLFVWIYLFVPRSSVLWKWPLCSGLGLIIGMGIFLIPAAVTNGGLDFTAWPFAVSAGFTGALTCLFASLTAPRFHEK